MAVKNIALLGSTGSIGCQALDVIARHPDRFNVVSLCAGRNAERLFQQARRFHPVRAGLLDECVEIPDDLRDIDWVFGRDALVQCAAEPTATHVLHAVVGMAGLPAALETLKQGKQLLLANKESLVAGGALVTEAAKAAGSSIIPIDSEHSAIFQCLNTAAVRPSRLLLTASGGPFRTWDSSAIAKATKADALHHPNWSMGAKITIDSATMVNKALEVMEARWLFGMDVERIGVVIHPQSVIHSMVEFGDGATLAQLGTPDMRVPIAYALTYPERVETGAARLDWNTVGSLTFEPPDEERFPALRLGREAMKAGGTAPVTFNSSNEEAVAAFLDDRIHFGEIIRLVEDALNALPASFVRTLDDVLDADRKARAFVRSKLAD